MTFSLRNIFIGLIFFILILGVIFVFIATIVFSGKLNDEIISEKKIELTSIGDIVFSVTSRSEFDQDVIHTALNTMADQRGVRFIHLFDTSTREILSSSNSVAEGSFLSTVPPFETNGIRITGSMADGTQLVHLVYANSGGLALWLSYEQVFLSGPTLTLALQLMFLFATLIALFAAAVYVMGNSFIVNPLRSIQESLHQIGQGNFATRLPQGPPNEFGVLFDTFNAMASILEVSRDRDAEISRMKSSFISTAAHQLRTPLTSTQWAVQALRDEDFGPVMAVQKKVLTDTSQKLKELSSIVSTLLDIAGLEEGKTGYIDEVFPVHDLLNEVLGEYDDFKDAPELSFETDSAHLNESATVLADRERVRWVIRALIQNALDYSKKHGTIKLTASSTADGVVIAVSDSGIGIPETEQSQVFEKFFRGTNAAPVNSMGSGLALYIAKKIITHYGGEISFESTAGNTVFTFTLPLHKEA